MKKFLLSISIITSFAGAIKAQMPLTVGHQWTKSYPAITSGFQVEQVASKETDNGYIISATNFRNSVDADPNPTNTVTVSSGNANHYNGLVTILNQNGNYQTHLLFSCTNESKIVSIATDSDNNIYVLGYSNALLTISDISGTSTMTVSTGYFLAKMNTNGFPLWAYPYNVSIANKFTSITTAEIGGVNRVFVGGSAYPGLKVDIKNQATSTFYPGSNGYYPIVIAYDEDCNYVNYNHMGISAGSGGINTINSLKFINNNLYLTGLFSGSLQIPALSINIASKGGDDVFVAKYDAVNLQPTWARRVGSNATDYAKTIDVDNNENVYFGGEFTGSGFNFDPAVSGTTNSNAENIFLIKLNSSGVFAWGRHFYGSVSSAETLNSIAVTGGGDIFMTGQARLRIYVYDHNANYVADINPTALNNNNALDIFLYRLNTNGGLEMTTHFGGSGNTAGSSAPLTNYERGVNLNLHNGNLYLSANTTILRNFNAENIDFNPAPFTFDGLTDYLSSDNNNQNSVATLTKYFVCTDNSSVGFPSSIVGTCPNKYLQYTPNPNNSTYSYHWNCASLGISSDSAILNIANPSAAFGGKIMNLQMTDANGCYKHLSAPIDGSGLSAASVSITSSATNLCNGNAYTFTATGSNVKWYANASDTISVASGNTYTYTPLLQQTTPMAIYASTTNTSTSCEEPRALHSFTVGVVPQPKLDSINSGPFVGCADGQPRYLNVFTNVNIFPDSLSNTIIGNTSSWWDLGSYYNMNTPDTITVWIEALGYIGPTNSIPCESIRYPVHFILINCNVTSISESSMISNTFKIYPNPANDVITINYDGLTEINSSIEITNTVGQIIMKQDVANETLKNINVSNLSNGIYFVQLKQNGKSIATKKLVINK